VTVAKEAEVPEGSMLGITVDGQQILLSKIGGKIYAMDAVCSHLSGYLPRGELRGHVVICPVHRAQFDITTGEVQKNVGALIKLASHKEATNLRSYQVEVVSGQVRLKLQPRPPTKPPVEAGRPKEGNA
jgi:nitrite reductase/ring-hydroxylating ferredoxin subunit